MFNLGMGEITVILLLALIFLGPAKLPELAAGLGKIIKEIRKATSDVKNEITLDDSFRKPFEDLRDAVTLHPDELKRRDAIRHELDEAARRRDEETAKLAESAAAGLPLEASSGIAGLAEAPQAQPDDTIIQALPSEIPPQPGLPAPPSQAQPAPAISPPVAPPRGTVARAGTLSRPPLARSTPAAAPRKAPASPFPPGPSAPTGDGGDKTNTTQILSEADLMPGGSSGKPPPPPPLPGLIRAPASPPPGAPGLPHAPGPNKKTT